MLTLVFAPRVCQGSRLGRRLRCDRPSRRTLNAVPEPVDHRDEYVLDGVLGHGGSGVVYRAHRAETPDQTVAVKVLDEHHRDDVHRDRLRREFDFARQVCHPHVITVYDSGPEWFAMELVTGGTVARLTERADVLTVLSQLAAALDHAHALGVVHCDVKPDNALLASSEPGPWVKLVDFGSARAVTAPSDRMNRVEASLPYTAPEVLRGHPPTGAADEYALACTAVEMLTGKPPFVATTAMGLIDNQLNSPVPRYSREIEWIPRAFDSILAKAMAKNPEARYPTCVEFTALITRALTVTSQ